MSENEVDNVVQFRPREIVDSVMGVAGAAGSSANDAETKADSEVPLAQRLEALLFVSPTPLNVEVLSDAAEAEVDDVQATLLEMMGEYCEGTRGIVLERVAGGWAFRAADSVSSNLSRLVKPSARNVLSPSALESLAIVAYLQPVSRPDIARIRGVSVDAAMNNLIERGFIEEAGRGESGAVLFRTTSLFERAFGLAGLSSLPPIEDFTPDEAGRTRLAEQLDSMAAARVE